MTVETLAEQVTRLENVEDMLAREAQVSAWQVCNSVSDLPQGAETQRTKKTSKGDRTITEYTAPQFIAQTKCGKTMITHLLKEGRVLGLATDELPTRWMHIPE